MKLRVIDRQTSNNAQSPLRVIEQTTGREVGWINRYLDREYVRRLAPGTLRLYADKSFPTLLVRSLQAFNKRIYIASQWAWEDLNRL
jgi:hypothetical protein